MTTLTLSGPGSVFAATIKDFQKWKGRLPSRDSAHFEVSSDVHAAYRKVIVARCGGTDEYRRLRKKTPKGEWRGLKYAAYQVREVDTLPPDSLNFVVEKWEESVSLQLAQVDE